MALSKEKKEALKTDFEAGKIPVTEIAKKHEVNPATIYRLEKKETWSRKKRKGIAKPKPKQKPKAGRPLKYDKKMHPTQATALCMLGYTNEQIAEFFGVKERIFYYWKKKYPEFLQALSAGREKASMKVIAGLFKRASGHSYDEVKKEYEGDDLIKKTVTQKYYPPETKAAALWLKNKYPELWKEKQEIEGSMNMKVGEITKKNVEKVKDLFDQITEE